MSELFAPSIDDQIAEVEREITQRLSVYPRLIAAHRLSEPKARRQIDLMRAVLATLRHVKQTDHSHR